METNVKTEIPHYLVYADGACKGNGQENPKAGWGAIVRLDGGQKKKSLNGCIEGRQTNQRAEIIAAIEGLEYLVGQTETREINQYTVTVRSDSAYLVNAVSQKWIHSWVKNGWVTKSHTAVQNKDLWQKLIEVCNRSFKTTGAKVVFEHVDGHSGDENNELADKLASDAANGVLIAK